MATSMKGELNLFQVGKFDEFKNETVKMRRNKRCLYKKKPAQQGKMKTIYSSSTHRTEWITGVDLNNVLINSIKYASST